MDNLHHYSNRDAMLTHGRDPVQVLLRFPLDIGGSNNYKEGMGLEALVGKRRFWAE